ncbi:MAG: S8 family serine peptidase [Chloroflexota bacterium]
MSIAYGVSWTDDRPIRRVATILLVAAVALGGLLVALQARTSGSLPVIVRSTADSVAAARDQVLAAGGSIDLELGIINGFRATVPAAALAGLAASQFIWSITDDSRVTMQSDPGYAPTDDGSPYLAAQAIGAPMLWHTGITGRGVDVAMIDTGVVPVPELAGRIVNGPDLSPESQSDNLRYLDSYGHGTHMAGLILGRDAELAPGELPNSTTFTGVAPEARLVSIKVANYNGTTDVSQVLAAIDWVVQHRKSGDLNIRVLNLSFGTDGTQDYRLDPLTYAVEVAWRAGIVVVAAGGNTGFGSAHLNNPAYDPFVIAVGADDTRGNAAPGNDRVPDFSSRGLARKVDFVAPGKSVISLRAAGSYIDQNSPLGRVGERFFRGSGTSQAAAVTSGAIALLLQQRPELTPDQVKYLLREGAAPMPSEPTVADGEGLLRIDRAASKPTPTGTAHVQTWEPATGLGSLDASRGNAKIHENGTALTGERDIFGQDFATADWAPRSADGTSWSEGSWMGRKLTGQGWCESTWTGSSWTGSSWTGSSWTGSSWTGSSWTGSSWTGSSWTGSSWTGSSWTGSSWTANFWSGAGWGN